jgi:hypothetical protein
VRADDEVVRGDLSPAADRRRDHYSIQRQRNRGPLRGGVHVGQGAAHGSAVADLEMPDVRDRGPDQARHAGVVLEVALACHGTNAHAPVRDRYLLQFGNPMQVHDVARPNTSHRQEWNQALATGEGLGLVAVLGHEPQRLLKHRWPVVLERWRLQCRGPPLVITVVRWILPQPAHKAGRWWPSTDGHRCAGDGQARSGQMLISAR